MGSGRWKRPRKPKFRGRMVVVFEMAADYFRGDVHQASETNGNMGIVRVFLIVQSLRLSNENRKIDLGHVKRESREGAAEEM